MAFKADASFLKYVTMGALGSLAVLRHLQAAGFEPIELERYCTSNKIWATKVKRLRLPDLLCVRTGIRFEARAKSDLAVKMSHSPNNAQRAWDAGLRSQDLVAFVKMYPDNDSFRAALPTFFGVADLQATFATAKLGPPKSQSEGAERDVVWPAWVPTTSGRVESVDGAAIKIVKSDGRSQTYPLGTKRAYAVPGSTFTAGEAFLAGSPAAVVNIAALLATAWNPTALLASVDAVDRYSAVKALPRILAPEEAAAALRSHLLRETEPRVRLETAASLARLDVVEGLDHLRSQIASPSLDYLRMEAILILGEVATASARDLLVEAAQSAALQGDEARQAAVWGLGHAGCRSYRELIPFLADTDDDVALHAVCGFAKPVPAPVGGALAAVALGADARGRAAAITVLGRCGGPNEIRALAGGVGGADTDARALAGLAKFRREAVVAAGINATTMSRLDPLYALVDPRKNWLAKESVAGDLTYLGAQGVHG